MTMTRNYFLTIPFLPWTASVRMQTISDILTRILTSPWFTVFLVLLGIFLLLLLLLRVYGNMRSRRLSRIVYERHFSEEGVYEGDEVELIETVRNPGFFPLFGVDIEAYFYNELDLEEYEPDAGSTMQYVISRFNLWPYMQIRRHHRLTARRRGDYRLHTVTVYNSKSPIPLEAPAELFVYPCAVPLHLPALAVGQMQGEYPSKRPLYTDPFSLAGIRDYRFGDPVSQINFKASARVPMTGFSASPFKVNARDFCASRRLMVYMDFHLPTGSKIDGAEYTRRAERGLSFCAALIRDAIYGGFCVGFAANCKDSDGRLSSRFPCEGSQTQLLAIMKEMARMNPTDGASFGSLLERDLADGMHDTEVVILSSNSYEENEEILDRIRLLERLGNSVQHIILGEVDDDGCSK